MPDLNTNTKKELAKLFFEIKNFIEKRSHFLGSVKVKLNNGRTIRTYTLYSKIYPYISNEYLNLNLTNTKEPNYSKSLINIAFTINVLINQELKKIFPHDKSIIKNWNDNIIRLLPTNMKSRKETVLIDSIITKFDIYNRYSLILRDIDRQKFDENILLNIAIILNGIKTEASSQNISVNADIYDDIFEILYYKQRGNKTIGGVKYNDFKATIQDYTGNYNFDNTPKIKEDFIKETNYIGLNSIIPRKALITEISTIINTADLFQNKYNKIINTLYEKIDEYCVA